MKVYGAIPHSALLDVTSDQHHAKLHQLSHLYNGDDPIDTTGIKSSASASYSLSDLLTIFDSSINNIHYGYQSNQQVAAGYPISVSIPIITTKTALSASATFRTGDSTYTITFRVYVNGVSVGTASTSSTSYVTLTVNYTLATGLKNMVVKLEVSAPTGQYGYIDTFNLSIT